MRVLLAEDDDDLRRGLRKTLERRSYVVDEAVDGEEAHYFGATTPYAAIILDIGLPAMDGLSVLSRWREASVDTPVILLTARDQWRDKVQGLRAGADDYLAKPFQTEELLARIEALIRRSAGLSSSVVSIDGLEIDMSAREAALEGEVLALTPTEYRILAFLAVNRGRVISRMELTEHIYHQDYEKTSNVIEATIARLRKKVGAETVKTHRGHGYSVG